MEFDGVGHLGQKAEERQFCLVVCHGTGQIASCLYMAGGLLHCECLPARLAASSKAVLLGDVAAPTTK